MSNPAAEIEYLLKTRSDLTGQQNYVRGLQEQISAQGAAGNSTAALEAKLRAYVVESNAALAKTKELTAEQIQFAASVEMAEASLVRFHDASANSTAGLTGTQNFAGAEATAQMSAAESAAYSARMQRMTESVAAGDLWIANLEKQEAALTGVTAAEREAAIAQEAALAEEADIASNALGMKQLETRAALAAAAGHTEEAAAIQFEIDVRKQAVALIAKGVEVDTAYIAAVQSVAAAAQEEAAAEAAATEATAAKIAAKKAAAVAEEEEAVATGVNTVAQREALVIMRELMMGRFSRIPGSASVLAGSMGAAVGPVMAATAALYIGYEAWKTYSNGIKQAREEQLKYGEEIDKFNLRIKDSSQKTRDAAEELGASLDRIRSKVDSITDSLATLNRVQQEAEDLQSDLAKTHATATEAMHKPGENKFQAAEEDFVAKQTAEKAERAAADAEARRKYQNQLDATNKADDAARQAGLEAQSTTVSAGTAKTNLDTVNFQQGERQRLIDRMQKEFGLTYEQVDLIKSGKSWGDLTGLKGGTYDSGWTDAAKGGTPAPITFSNPLTASNNLKNFHEVFQQFQGTTGGYGGDEASQQQRVLDAQNQYDKAKSANDAATQSAHDLTEEFKKLKTELDLLHESFPAESADRNQKGQIQTVEDLKELRKVSVAAQDELIKKHFPEDSRLNAIIAQIDVKLQALSTSGQATSTVDFKNSTAPASSNLDSQIQGTMERVMALQIQGNEAAVAMAEQHLAKQQLLQQALKDHHIASQATYDLLISEVNDARVSLKQLQSQIQSN